MTYNIQKLITLAIIILSIIAFILFVFIKLSSNSNLSDNINDTTTNYQLTSPTPLSCTKVPLTWYSTNLPTYEDWMDRNTYMPWKIRFIQDLIIRCYNAFSLTTNNTSNIYNTNNFLLPPSLSLYGNTYSYNLETILTGNSYTYIPGVSDGEALYGGVFSFRKNGSNTGIYIIAMRGTQNVSDWIQNVSIGKVCAKWLYEKNKISSCGTESNCGTILSVGQSGCQVHSGWNEIYTSTPTWIGSRKTSLQYQLRTWLNSNINNVKNLILTGHSLGGAVATLAFADIYMNYTFTFSLSLFTFATPRPFNTNLTNALYTSFLTDINKIRIMNMANYADIVTKLPFDKSLGIYSTNFKTLPNVYYKPSIGRTVVEEIIDDKNPFGFTESETAVNLNLFHCLTTYEKITIDIAPRFKGSSPVDNTFYIIYFLNYGSIVKNSDNTLSLATKPGDGSKFICLFNGTYWCITNYTNNYNSIAQSSTNTSNTIIVNSTYYAYKFLPNNDYNNTYTILSGVSKNYLGPNMKFSPTKYNVMFIKI
jgi:hypothetical protein